MESTQTSSAAKAAVVISTSAAIAAALAWLKTDKAQAAEPGTIPEELLNLVIAIANSADRVDENTLGIITAVKELVLGGGLGWPLNTDSIAALRVAILPTGTQLEDLPVPSGMALVIKAWPTNPGWLQLGASLSGCVNVNQSFTLIPSETVTYQVQNANQIWIGATAAGCFANITVEHRRGGGGG